MMLDRELLVTMLKKHEGFRGRPYQDSVGKTTIGYGHNLDDKPITMMQAERLLNDDIDDALSYCVTLEYWDDLSPIRRAVIADMMFNLGPKRFRGFVRMHNALVQGKYAKAAHEMMDSKWATQVGRRARVLSEMMREDAIVREYE